MAAVDLEELEIEAQTETRSSSNQGNNASSNNTHLIKKPNTTSVVWNYFSVKADDKGVPIPSELNSPVCNICDRTVLAKRSNTTNLFCHLEEHHPEEYATITPTQSRLLKKQDSV